MFTATKPMKQRKKLKLEEENDDSDKENTPIISLKKPTPTFEQD